LPERLRYRLTERNKIKILLRLRWAYAIIELSDQGITFQALPGLLFTDIVNKCLVPVCFPESYLIQHMLTSSVLNQRVRINCVQSHVAEGVFQSLELCLGSAAMILAAVILQMDSHGVAAFTAVNVFQYDLSNGFVPKHDRQMNPIQITLPLPVSICLLRAIAVGFEPAQVRKHIRIMSKVLKKSGGTVPAS